MLQREGYGCREATDMEPTETVLGFPGDALDGLVEELEHLNARAIGRSRAKVPLKHIKQSKE